MTDTENLAIYTHGKFLMQWQLLERARAVAEGLVTISPNFAYGWMLLSQLYPEGEQTLSYAKRAFQTDQKNMEIAFHYCNLEITIGDSMQVKPILNDMLTRDDFWSERARLMLQRISLTI